MSENIQENIGENELQTRTKDFVEKYGKLVEESNMDFASYPAFMPDGKGGFLITIQSVPVDVTDRPKPSPFIKQD